MRPKILGNRMKKGEIAFGGGALPLSGRVKGGRAVAVLLEG
jgi:hypothetical protein